MIKPETTPSPTIGLTHIDLVPVFDKGKVVLYDMYYAGEWLGSKRTLRYCIIFNRELRKNKVAKEIKV